MKAKTKAIINKILGFGIYISLFIGFFIGGTILLDWWVPFAIVIVVYILINMILLANWLITGEKSD